MRFVSADANRATLSAAAAARAGVERPAAYRPDIDGLRAIAVLAVVLFHLFPRHVKGGFVGVDIFFVISGFLISGIILDSLQKRSFSYAGFYARRIKRIFPALAIVLACCLLIGWAIDFPAEFRLLGQHVVAAAGFFANIQFWRESGYFDQSVTTKPLLHLWSLGVEEQFYLVWPLVLASLYPVRRFWRALVAITVASFAANLALTYRFESAAFYLPFTRLWELTLGSVLACYAARSDGRVSRSPKPMNHIVSIAGLALILFAIIFITGGTGFPGWPATLPVVGAFLLIAAGPDAWINNVILSRRPLVWIGLISYPLYLWHWPLLTFASSLGIQSPWARIGIAGVSIVLSWLTYRLIETPVRLGPAARWKPIVCLTSLAAVASVGAIIWRTDLSPVRLAAPPFGGDLADNSSSYYRPCSDPVKRIDPPLNLCSETIESPASAAVFGDSHADSIFHGIAQEDRQRNWLLIGNSSCPPLNGVSVNFRLDTANLLQCRPRMEAATRYIVDEEKIGTVVLAFFGAYFLDSDVAADHLENQYGPSAVSLSSSETNLTSKRDLFFYGLEKTVTILQSARKRVVLLLDTPEWPFFPRDAIRLCRTCGLLNLGPRIPLQPVLDRQSELRAAAQKLKQRFPELSVIDPLRILCGRDCPLIMGDTLLYRDSHHLSKRGSRLVARELLHEIALVR